MEARLRSWFRQLWQRIKQYPYTIGVVVVLMLILFIFFAYLFGWDWTGVSGGVNKVTTTMTTPGTTATSETTVAIEQPPAKTIWDWLQLFGLLGIPIVVIYASARLNHDLQIARVQQETSLFATQEQQRQETLQDYLTQMSELLLNKNLRNASAESEVRALAKVRTLTALRALDSNRKGILLQFLKDSRLIDKGASVISLRGADLSGANLSQADLRRTWLRSANLSGANLSQADLEGVDLCGSNLSGADLTKAHLEEAGFVQADLSEANLRGAWLNKVSFRDAALRKANLSNAILFNADLSNANLDEANLNKPWVTKDQVDKARSFKGATMPNGSIYP